MVPDRAQELGRDSLCNIVRNEKAVPTFCALYLLPISRDVDLVPRIFPTLLLLTGFGTHLSTEPSNEKKPAFQP